MFIPVFIPVPPIKSDTETKTVINKTIVYSDTVLPLKNTGDNLKVTSIDDVSESSLEECLKIILESNPNVIFNTIQYSKNNKKVYFYTNQEITKKAYEESKYVKYKPINSRNEILEEIKKVLIAPSNKDNDCISLFDIVLLLKISYDIYRTIPKKYEEDFRYILKREIDENSICVIHGFDFTKKLLEISFSKNREFKNIFFAKQNDDLYVYKSDSIWSNEVLQAIGPGLSNLYDELIKYASHEEYKFGIESVNSNFSVDISKMGVEIILHAWKDNILDGFYLKKYNDNDFNLTCNSNAICETVKGHEDEIFKRIFVKISDCPKWCQPKLYEIRKAKLAEEQRIEEERQYREAKKQKRLEFVKRIFPFSKRQK